MTSEKLRERGTVDGRSYARRSAFTPPSDRVIRNHFLLSAQQLNLDASQEDFEGYKAAFLEGQKAYKEYLYANPYRVGNT